MYGMMSLEAWLKQVGVTACTAWRWRKRGWLQTVNICGRVYVTAAAMAEFVQRAERGEFAREHKVPRRAGNEGKESHAQPA
jgi:hypothetical protein